MVCFRGLLKPLLSSQTLDLFMYPWLSTCFPSQTSDEQIDPVSLECHEGQTMSGYLLGGTEGVVSNGASGFGKRVAKV